MDNIFRKPRLVLGVFILLSMFSDASVAHARKTDTPLCEKHREVMLPDDVAIYYGLLSNESFKKLSYEKNQFPNANTSVLGGCLVGKKKHTRVFYCPICRKAQQEWEGAESVSTLRKELSKLNLKDPEAEARNNLSHGKNHFLRLVGYSTYYPGVADADLHYVKEMGAVTIKGTSDAIENKEHDELIEQARRYAGIYNETLIKILKTNTSLAFWPTITESLQQYANAPSSKNALKVIGLLPTKHVAYDHSAAKEKGLKEIENIFPILEKQIKAHHRDSIKMAFHLYVLTDGALWETLDIDLGKLIRIDPQLFLEELNTSGKSVSSFGHLVGNLGPKFVDRLDAQCLEMGSRIRALKTVNIPALQKLKEQCVSSLEETIKAYCHAQ